jgi:hypothetical protein
MPDSPAQRVDRALLIGIDSYQYISPELSGCVGDVNRVADLLERKFHTPPERIIKLTSSADGTETPEQLATRENIVKGFQALAQQAAQGEQVYIQYSGHGMRNDSTLLPGIEPDGRDEAIAPCDSGYSDPAAYYILDKELGWLIRQITDKGAFVTFVSDCCHSASMTRALPDVKVRKGHRRDGEVAGGRAWEGGDPRPRPDETLVAPLAELRALVVAPDGATGSLLPAPKNYILITGCRERETAKEYRSNGVLTYFMLEHLEQADLPGLTYRALCDVAGSKILQLADQNASYRDQAPQLEGNGNLIVFGGGAEKAAAALVATPLAGGKVQVSGGGAIGLSVGTLVALYPTGTIDFQDTSKQLGVISLSRVDPDVSVGELVDAAAGELTAGMRAMIVRPGSTKVQRRVAIGTGPGLDALKQAAAAAGGGKGSPYVLVVEPGDKEDFSVVVEGGNFQICQFRDGQNEPLPRISPPIGVNEPGAAARVLQRLEHIIQYRNAWELTNDVDSSTLANRLAITVRRKSSRAAGRVQLQPGEDIEVRIHNRSDRPLSAALFYFGPDWSVTRIWPDDMASASYAELAVNGDEGLAVWDAQVELPPNVTSSVERLKLLATDKPTSFDALALGSLDVARRVTRSVGGNDLENMLTDLGAGRRTRELTSRRARSGDWGTAELELETTTE